MGAALIVAEDGLGACSMRTSWAIVIMVECRQAAIALNGLIYIFTVSNECHVLCNNLAIYTTISCISM